VTYPDRKPECWGDCAKMPRPCPFISCRYHFYLDVGRRGTLKVNALVRGIEDIDRALRALPATCAIDVANQNPDGLTLEEIGALFGLTRERIRQVEVAALWSLTLALARERRKESI
jgi:hypothetical protein